jgi:hypothetical protein
VKLILNLTLAISCVASPLVATAQTPVLLQTFTNPTPLFEGYFSAGVAALGNDRVLVGARNNATTATNAGAVYLFHTNGTLLTTFTNPIPASVPDWYFLGEWFGGAVAAVGSDRVLIGSARDGKTYLFTTNGVLVKTISQPNLEDAYFGHAVAAFGNDKMLIGSPWSNMNPETYDNYGAAYLYSTNGALLGTFTHTSIGEFYQLGFSVAAFGSDRVLIGTSSGPLGAALFHTNGTLLMKFSIPPSTDLDYPVGHPVAAVGTDRVLVGVPGYGSRVGAVHLFNTNGTLLLTITNPTPVTEERFGSQIAMLGNDRVVISAPLDSTTGTNAGSAYVFNLNGTLLATLNNPTPAIGDFFGYRLTAFGNEGVIIGTPFDGTGATSAGSAYLFNMPAVPVAPSLTIGRTTTNTVVVSWPSTATGFVLQQNTNGVGSVNWSNVTTGIQNDGINQTLIVNPPAGYRFYRLVSP